jgi:ribosomal protein S12 methylthiotransferase accessory factor
VADLAATTAPASAAPAPAAAARGGGTDRIALPGTYRARYPEQTWELIRPRLSSFGVTRIADVTGLDVLGIPVAMSVRPLARTLSVSQGKGHTYPLARVSAAMEAIELWHAEFAYPAPTRRAVPAAALELPYAVGDLPAAPGSLVTAATPLDWVDAVGMVSGRTVPVPSDLVAMAATDRSTWHPPGFVRTSNGLASGNTRDEATLHALYEVVERDAVSGHVDAGPDDELVLESVTDAGCAELIDRIRRAGAVLTATQLPNRFGLPCFRATVWSADFPLVNLGFGAHLTPGIALSRAITEAVQSRLTAIAGSRDDMSAIFYERLLLDRSGPPATVPPALDWTRVARPATHFAHFAAELDWVRARVSAVTGSEPLLVDLSSTDDFAVVRVIAPGSLIDMDRVHPR